MAITTVGALYEILGPVQQAFNPIGRNLLGLYTVTRSHLVAGDRRVPLRRNGYDVNLQEAIVVLAVDQGLRRVRHRKGARRLRELLIATASTLLMLGLVDPAEDA